MSTPAPPSDSKLFTEARQFADQRGLAIGHSKLSRLIRAYRRELESRNNPAEMLTLDTYLRRIYPDPTGESAVRRLT